MITIHRDYFFDNKTLPFFETFAQWFSTRRFKEKTTTFVYFEQFFSDF